MDKLKPCPFCGGMARFTAKQAYFRGKNGRGNVRLIWRVRVMCNKCRTMGPPVLTDVLPLYPDDSFINIWNFWATSYARGCQEEQPSDKAFRAAVEKAAEAWNRRNNDG